MKRHSTLSSSLPSGLAHKLRTGDGMASEKTGSLGATAGARLLASRYRLVERIDEGGAGEVWRARDEKLDRNVAIKLLGPDADDAFRARFADEARRAAAVVHPNGVTDFYGLGLVAYELLTGRPAFDGATSEELVRERLIGPPPSLRLARVGIDDRLDAIVGRALATLPDRRYASAGAFARAFSDVADRDSDPTSSLGSTRARGARGTLPRFDNSVAILAV